MSLSAFAETVRPLAQALAGIDLRDAHAARQAIQAAAPFEGDLIATIRAEAVRGAQEGWLVPKSAGAVRFGRVAKEFEGFSLDAVEMSTPGPRHRHPCGEIDLCFATDGEPRFDGQPEGWVVYPPESVHVPTVAGGTMVILYFLPGGAIEFLKD